MSKPDWKQVKAYEDITYHKCDGVARIAFDRPEVRNAFRPDTLLFYMTEQGQKGKKAYLEKRPPNFRQYQ